jgi:hypothetical protein
MTLYPEIFVYLDDFLAIYSIGVILDSDHSLGLPGRLILSLGKSVASRRSGQSLASPSS